jgi:hypothetical protein
MGPDPENPVSAPLQDFQKDLAINSVSAYAAAQAAVAGFNKLPKDVKKTFIYTGNNGNTLVGRGHVFEKIATCLLSQVTPMFLMLGIGKTGAWYMIQTLAASSSLASKGCRFYYVDERTPVGKAMFHVSGPAHEVSKQREGDITARLCSRCGGSEVWSTRNCRSEVRLLKERTPLEIK